MARYSYKTPTLAPDDFAQLAKLCEKVISFVECNIAGWDGYGKPVFNNNEIVFNGAYPNSKDTFSISFAGKPKYFVETGDHEYDLAVRCCLTVFLQEFGDRIKITSNIPEDSLDWIQASVIVEAMKKNQSVR